MRRAGPELTVFGVVNTPPERVAATLAPLNPLEPEVVLAVDDRVDPGWISGYRRIADRVFVVPFPGAASRLYTWLRAQCAGQWAFQFDADEVPGPGLCAEVAEAMTTGDVTHCWIPRRWLYPDAGSWLAQWPWRPDYQLRLFLNNPAIVRFPALLHLPVEAVGARRFLREPLYHADLLLNGLEARERKCERYERIRPGLAVDGRPHNEAYYLPERREGLKTAPVPAADAAAVDGFLEPAAVPAGPPRAEVSSPGLEELTRVYERRPLRPDTYRARLRLLDDDLRVTTGEWRTFNVEVTNHGGEPWPGGMDPHPQIRLAYRWLGDNGEPDEGSRTAFGAPIESGRSAIVPLEVLGPAHPGEYRLEIDLVHEHVRWFGCAVTATLEARQPRLHA